MHESSYTWILFHREQRNNERRGGGGGIRKQAGRHFFFSCYFPASPHLLLLFYQSTFAHWEDWRDQFVSNLLFWKRRVKEQILTFFFLLQFSNVSWDNRMITKSPTMPILLNNNPKGSNANMTGPVVVTSHQKSAANGCPRSLTSSASGYHFHQHHHQQQHMQQPQIMHHPHANQNMIASSGLTSVGPYHHHPHHHHHHPPSTLVNQYQYQHHHHHQQNDLRKQELERKRQYRVGLNLFNKSPPEVCIIWLFRHQNPHLTTHFFSDCLSHYHLMTWDKIIHVRRLCWWRWWVVTRKKMGNKLFGGKEEDLLLPSIHVWWICVYNCHIEFNDEDTQQDSGKKGIFPSVIFIDFKKFK